MCLSTIYRDSVKQDNMVMKNVRMIEYQDGEIVLTDLMERQVAVEGELVMANLVDGVAVIREKANLADGVAVIREKANLADGAAVIREKGIRRQSGLYRDGL